ncbi:hypothetical protein DDZ18_01070 [Marinicauda salina]|uniref:DUF945 domain-containing protein n=1 Tax=Marinicauda salina TaxID=2135793 RepID=A0A2U2BW30_9PROT|nr:hypothetical protein [Marinicauda salina]PWE18231.1 hypothetical protein DDZ18_01070 [Marinicauda salina]
MKLAAYAVTGALAIALAACGEDSADEDRGDRAAATQVSAAEAEAGLAAMGLAEPGRASWDERSFADGTYTFSGFTFETEEADAPLTVETLVLSAPRVEDEMVMFDRLELENAGMTDSDGEVSLEHFVIDRPGEFLARQVADFFTGAENETDAEGLTDEQLAGYRFAEVSMTGLTVVAPEGENARMELAGLAFDGFDGETLARFDMGGFRFEADDEETGPVTVTLDEVVLEGLSSAYVRTIAESARGQIADGAKADAPNVNLANPFNPADVYDMFAVRGLDVDAGGVIIAMPEFSGEVNERRGAVRSTAAMPSMTLSANPDLPMGARLADGLQRLGYESLDFSMAAESVYDPSDDRVRTEGDNYFEMRDGFRLSFEQDFGGVTEYTERYLAAMAEGDLDAGELPPEVFEPLLVHSFSMRLEDRSLLDRALEAGAEAQGVTPEELRMQAAAMVGMGLMAASAEAPQALVASLGQALTGFINQGGALLVSVAPDEPVSVGEIMADPNAMDAERLGLTVTNEPAE